MTLEDTLRQIIREELAGVEARLAERLRAQPAGTSGDRLLKPTEAERLTGYSRETILGWVRAGKLQRHGTIRGVRVSEADLRAFLSRAVFDNAGSGDDLPKAKILELARRHAKR